MVETVDGNPTYNVSSELTLEVSTSDDNTLITCAVNHPSLSPGDKRSEQALRVLCKSTGKLGGRKAGTEATRGWVRSSGKPQTALFLYFYPDIFFYWAV